MNTFDDLLRRNAAVTATEVQQRMDQADIIIRTYRSKQEAALRYLALWAGDLWQAYMSYPYVSGI